MVAETCLPFRRGEPDAHNIPGSLMAVPVAEWKHRVPSALADLQKARPHFSF